MFNNRSPENLWILAEIGVNHNGDINLAKEMIHQSKRAGFDGVKFQYYIIDELLDERTPAAPYQGNTNQNSLLKSFELTISELKSLEELSHQIGLDFVVTPFGAEALRQILEVNLDAIKIGSSDADNFKLLEAAVSTNLPLIISTGMLDHNELLQISKWITGAKDVVILHCVSAYPTNLGESKLRRILDIKEIFGTPVGFSDHTLGYGAACAAIALGAIVIEKHVTINQNDIGPDHRASLELKDAGEFVFTLRAIAQSVSGTKGQCEEELLNRPVVKKALYLATNKKAGDIVFESDLTLKRPLLDGISAILYPNVLGKVLTVDKNAGDRLLPGDIKWT